MQVIADNLHRAIAVVSRPRDTIFQSLGLEGVKSRLETLKSPENEHVSELFLKVRFKIEQGNLN